MKIILWANILGLMAGAALNAQRVPCLNGSLFVYSQPCQLSVTALDWKFESKTGLSTNRIEQQVRMRLMKELGWRAGGVPEIGGKVHRSMTRVDVNLDIAEQRQKVAYIFTVTVTEPKNRVRAPRVADETKAWQWTQSGQGVSTLGDYPRHFRKDMDAVLQELAKAWRGRWKE